MILEFHSPNSGDWTEVVNGVTKERVYSGHSGMSDILRDILQHLKITVHEYWYTQSEFEEKF